MRRSAIQLQHSLDNTADFNDARTRSVGKRLLPGEIKTADVAGEVLVTVLGSCVAACVRNPYTGAGGMNHFMLPESETGDWNGPTAKGRYGNFAMDALIDKVLRTGCRKDELEVKLFGGADLYRGSIMVGSMNVEFVLDYMAQNGLRPAAQDLGGKTARKIVYTPSTGQVMRQVIRPHSKDELRQLEKEYLLALRDPHTNKSNR